MKEKQFLKSVPPTITLGRNDLSPERMKFKSIYNPSWRILNVKSPYQHYCDEVKKETDYK